MKLMLDTQKFLVFSLKDNIMLLLNYDLEYTSGHGFFIYFFGVTCSIWLYLLDFVLFLHQVVLLIHLAFR